MQLIRNFSKSINKKALERQAVLIATFVIILTLGAGAISAESAVDIRSAGIANLGASQTETASLYIESRF